MVRGLNPGLWIVAIVLLLTSGCATIPVNTEQTEFPSEESKAAHVISQPAVAPPSPKVPVKSAGKDFSTVRRKITEKEVRRLEAKDPELGFARCIEILCRLNRKDREYIRLDMKRKRTLIVPKNFSAYKDWSPLPWNITGAGKFPKLILVVKNIHFLGWYHNGRLVGDTYVCVGKMNTWTKRGMYRVTEKDPRHMSTYPNAYGEPAYMPDALHIYERVWIHTGDVIGPNCSHGCINVPIDYSEKLYDWADVGTAVLITESLKDVGRDIKTKPVDGRQKPEEGREKKSVKTGDGGQQRPLNETPKMGKKEGRRQQESVIEAPKQFSGNSTKDIMGGM